MVTMDKIDVTCIPKPAKKVHRVSSEGFFARFIDTREAQ